MNNVTDEDEDIIVEGSALYEHLRKIGYTDFESIPVHRSTVRRKNSFKFSNITKFVKSIVKKLFIMYSWIMREEDISKKQLICILDMKALLDDHSHSINNIIEKHHGKSYSSTLQEFIFFGAMMTSSMYISLRIRYNICAGFIASVTLLFFSYIRYSRLCAHRNLKSVVSLQNELFDLCKKGLKIMRYGYSLKINKGKFNQQFYDLTADRLKYLQPIMENLMVYMERVSYIYYHVSLVLVKLLPVNILHEDLLTKFEEESFEIHGEVDYRTLKHFYHIYILTQSEMLQLLAIAYNCQTWQQSCDKMPEFKLAYILKCLMLHLEMCKSNLSEVINVYYSCKVKPMGFMHRGPITSKWQHLYVNLYLTSNKLQLAYNHILSIQQDIDDKTSDNVDDNETAEIIMEKLNEAYKEIEAAKNCTEFSSLLVAKTRLQNSTNDQSEKAVPTLVDNSDVPVTTNTEPQIMDEVFEEYIKEEYLKPLYEENDEISEEYKWDKLLAKSFMAELKDALIDKQKSMAIRESKALQRMYKHMIKDSNLKVDNQKIPTPPPMPSVIPDLPIPCKTVFDHSNDTPKSFNPETIKYSKKSNTNDSSDEDIYPTPFILLPKMQVDTETEKFSLPSLPHFLKADEETFIGSGENSEDEFVEDKGDDET